MFLVLQGKYRTKCMILDTSVDLQPYLVDDYWRPSFCREPGHCGAAPFAQRIWVLAQQVNQQSILDVCIYFQTLPNQRPRM